MIVEESMKLISSDCTLKRKTETKRRLHIATASQHCFFSTISFSCALCNSFSILYAHIFETILTNCCCVLVFFNARDDNKTRLLLCVFDFTSFQTKLLILPFNYFIQPLRLLSMLSLPAFFNSYFNGKPITIIRSLNSFSLEYFSLSSSFLVNKTTAAFQFFSCPDSWPSLYSHLLVLAFQIFTLLL